MAALLCFASALNYIDRNTLAILAPTIQKELHWTDVDYANITVFSTSTGTVNTITPASGALLRRGTIAISTSGGITGIIS